MGLEIGASVEGHALAAGAEAEIGYFEEDEKKRITAKAGAALLFGGGVSFDVGW